MDLTYCKSQRRIARKQLRNYIVENFEDILKDFNLEQISKNEIKNMSSHCFTAWIMNNLEKFYKQRDYEDLNYYDLFDFISEFIAADNNVTIAESINILNI